MNLPVGWLWKPSKSSRTSIRFPTDWDSYAVLKQDFCELFAKICVLRLCDYGRRASLSDRGLIAFNIDDSRLYRFADRELVQLSIDDVARARNLLTNSLGGRPIKNLKAEAITEEVLLGTKLLICSDALHSYVSAAQISASMELDVEECAQELSEAALRSGGVDNISNCMLAD